MNATKKRAEKLQGMGKTVDSRNCSGWSRIPEPPTVRKVKEGETTNDLYAFPTSEPNAEVGAIHPKAMPVILTTPNEVENLDDRAGGGSAQVAAAASGRNAPDGRPREEGRWRAGDVTPSVRYISRFNITRRSIGL